MLNAKELTLWQNFKLLLSFYCTYLVAEQVLSNVLANYFIVIYSIECKSKVYEYSI